MISERTSVGLDVHARSVVATGLDSKTGEVFKTTLVPAHEAVIDWLRGLPGPIATTYEAGPTGFGLYRALTAAGIRCEVAAPSKLNRPSGERVKTDAKDALLLAQLLQVGQITSVRVPTVTEEAARDLVRAREDVRGDLLRARHRVSNCCCAMGTSTTAGKLGRAHTTHGCGGSGSTSPAPSPPTKPTSKQLSSPSLAGTGSTTLSRRWPPIPSSPPLCTSSGACEASRP
ncbi:IS110 family transposase [Nocardioides sp. LML1-1-1.1]|uniref:IS110 family transposase n=1 Tax=Nocardioides sp. LML1-1-1.1 TaxID=3135248 RepID=UPI00341B283F